MILISGSETAKDPEVSAMFAWLEDHGVPRDRIVADTGGTRTRATMSRAAGVFDIRRAIVCTNSLHLPRALYLARDEGIDAVGFAPDSAARRSPKRVGVEILKTALAVAESGFAPAPRSAAPPVVLSMR